MNADGARLKCNREKPCQNCTARDEKTTCIYRDVRDGTRPTAHQHEHGDPMQRRIEHLEGLIKRLIGEHQESSPSSVVSSQGSTEPARAAGFGTTAGPLNASDVVCSAGTTVIDGVHSVYKGTNDWHDVLQEVGHSLFSILDSSCRFISTYFD
jgi:hypothetical protein